MLTKNSRSALILSAAGTLSFALTSAVLNLALPYWLTGDLHAIVANPESLNRPADLLALALILLMALAALIAIGAYWLHRFFGPQYFGRRALLRWALFGALFAVLVKLPDWMLPSGWWLLKDIFYFLSVFAAFFIARWIAPVDKPAG